MNSLTVNLHLMMVSFYRPTSTRFKVLIESHAFPSDYHAVTSQIKFHGFDPIESLIQVGPRDDEKNLRTEDIENVIKSNKNEIALVLLSGVQYYTGQAFHIQRITALAREIGATVGWDLAHAVGNIPLELHDWGVDFACWCTYKYLNSGPGSIGGCFVHERHANKDDLPRFAGWWGHRKEDRFLMKDEFVPSYGAFGWQLSNPPVLPLAALRASLDLFEKATMDRLRAKSEKLTRYLELLLESNFSSADVRIITPGGDRKDERGCQLSLEFSKPVGVIYERLLAEGIIGDKREPNAMRIAPAPMYNSFADVYDFVCILKRLISEV